MKNYCILADSSFKLALKNYDKPFFNQKKAPTQADTFLNHQ